MRATSHGVCAAGGEPRGGTCRSSDGRRRGLASISSGAQSGRVVSPDWGVSAASRDDWVWRVTGDGLGSGGKSPRSRLDVPVSSVAVVVLGTSSGFGRTRNGPRYGPEACRRLGRDESLCPVDGVDIKRSSQMGKERQTVLETLLYVGLIVFLLFILAVAINDARDPKDDDD